MATEYHAAIEPQTDLFPPKMIKPHHYIYTNIPHTPWRYQVKSNITKIRIEARVAGKWHTQTGLWEGWKTTNCYRLADTHPSKQYDYTSIEDVTPQRLHQPMYSYILHNLEAVFMTNDRNSGQFRAIEPSGIKTEGVGAFLTIQRSRGTSPSNGPDKCGDQGGLAIQ